MRKFKLIKEYPFCQELGSIYTQQGPNAEWYRLGDNSGNITKEETLLKYPEYFQEIIEKDYEILSFIDNYNCIIIHKEENTNNMYSGSNFFKVTEETLIKLKDIKIYSVKRLSDGEIFTIGDNTTIGIINSIKFQKHLSKYPISLYGSINQSALNFRYLSGINKDKLLLQKVKIKLFTTEDGVDIFEGEDVWSIGKSYITIPLIMRGIRKDPSNNYRLFSTKEKAEEFILYNKPLITLKEVKHWLENPIYKSYIDVFTKLAKEKLK